MADVRVFATPYFRQIAGFWQHGGVTIATLYKWLDELTSPKAQRWALYPALADPDRSGEPAGSALERTRTDPVTPGDYVLLDGERKLCRVSLAADYPYPPAVSTANIGTHDETDFIHRVRERDMRCCLTGKQVPSDEQSKLDFFGFEVTHILPLTARTEFYRRFSRYITDPDVREDDKMNSVQQGFLVCNELYNGFANYEVGVDPYDGYRITDFRRGDPSPVDGRTFYIDPNVPEHYRPLPELLRDHFERCLLANVRVLPYRDIIEFDPELDDMDPPI